MRKPIKGRNKGKLNKTNKKLGETTSQKWITNRDLVRKSNRNTGINTRLKRPKYKIETQNHEENT